MASHILVLHGPNLNLLGERPGDPPELTLAEVGRALRERARQSGVELKIVQSNHEGELIDTLQRERVWLDAVLVDAGPLAQSGHALAETLAILRKPTLELATARKRTVLGCEGRIIGRGLETYTAALDRLLEDDVAGKKKRKAVKAPSTQKLPSSAKGGATKTLGRAGRSSTRGAKSNRTAPVIEVLSRALVRQKIADRLRGILSPSGLATWARQEYLDVQRGAPAESGHRDLLEDVLQQLTVSALPVSRLSDEELIDLMAQLGG